MFFLSFHRSVYASLKHIRLTLIELLVAIVLIAVLSALVFPATRAVSRQRIKHDGHSLHSLGAGFNLYAIDHNLCILRQDFGATGERRRRWPHSLSAYIKTRACSLHPVIPTIGLRARRIRCPISVNNTSFIMNRLR